MSSAKRKQLLVFGVVAPIVFAIAATLLTISANAFSSSKKQSEKVWITRPDGSLQCDPKPDAKDDPLLKARAELEMSGIRVYEAKKRNDGRMRATACGIASGNETAFLIEAGDVMKARAKDFTPVVE